MWLASDTRRQSIDRMRENSTDENVSVIYPAELENRARSAVIHMNAEEFTGCFQKFMKYGRIEVTQSTGTQRSVYRFAYAIINTAKECGTLRMRN